MGAHLSSRNVRAAGAIPGLVALLLLGLATFAACKPSAPTCPTGTRALPAGCGTSPAPETCMLTVPCERDADCAANRRCAVLTTDPCWGEPYDACGQHEKVCMDRAFAEQIRAAARPGAVLELPDFDAPAPPLDAGVGPDTAKAVLGAALQERNRPLDLPDFKKPKRPRATRR